MIRDWSSAVAVPFISVPPRRARPHQVSERSRVERKVQEQSVGLGDAPPRLLRELLQDAALRQAELGGGGGGGGGPGREGRASRRVRGGRVRGAGGLGLELGELQDQRFLPLRV